MILDVIVVVLIVVDIIIIKSGELNQEFFMLSITESQTSDVFCVTTRIPAQY